jgi:hypothetical protein
LAFQRGVFWGVVPYTPAAPFSVKFLRDYEEVDTAAELVRQFKQRDVAGDLPFSVQAKLRPVLALCEPSSILREITALKLANISRRVRQRLLTEEEEAAVIAGEHPRLMPLRREIVSSLTRTNETYAVIIDNPVTLHQSAVVAPPIGVLSEEEFRVVCQRFVQALQLDVAPSDDAEPTA